MSDGEPISPLVFRANKSPPSIGTCVFFVCFGFSLSLSEGISISKLLVKKGCPCFQLSFLFFWCAIQVKTRRPISSNSQFIALAEQRARFVKMLAVFNKSVAKCPEGLKNAESEAKVSALKDDLLLQHFSSVYPDAVSVNLGGSGIVAFSSDKQNPLSPRLFAVVDDIFCLFHGHVENIASLKQLYGLTKTANEVSIIIEAYRSVRDRGSHPADHALRTIEGKFAFIIYDGSTRTTFISVDADGSVPLFWGADSEENLVLSDNEEVVKKACGRSFAPFPKGCFFTSSTGLKSFEHPLKELKPVPWTDTSGQQCGSTFVVVEESKQQAKKMGFGAGMPRVDSDADWSKHI